MCLGHKSNCNFVYFYNLFIKQTANGGLSVFKNSNIIEKFGNGKYAQQRSTLYNATINKINTTRAVNTPQLEQRAKQKN